jgi:threonine dehydratase
MNSVFSPELFRAAHERIRPYVRHTPLLPRPSLCDDMHPQLRLKLENLQVSGSFKARGVFNHLLQLSEKQRERGVICASGGNHGLALAYGAWRLGIPATVYLPAGAAIDRVRRVEAWGARLIQQGLTWDDAHRAALTHAEAEGLYYVHPFDDPHTLVGQGTLGLELLADVPDLDCVLIAIGGGGLIAGIAAAIKQQRRQVRIIGVEPIGAAAMHHSLQAGAVVSLNQVNTIADTLAPRSVSARTLALTQQYVDTVVLISDAQMVDAMRWLWTECNQLVEPAGAAVIAALRQDATLIASAARPVAVICGGNAAASSVFTHYSLTT